MLKKEKRRLDASEKLFVMINRQRHTWRNSRKLQMVP